MNRNALSARWARVEQVDEVPEPDPLLVQEVVVLAAAVEPPAELQDRVVDRQQPVAVVEDERHVGHPERRALLGAGEDHVLRLAAAEGPALLAERPAQGIREVALARAVRPDDRADPGPELDDRPLRERLEALEPEGEETGGRASSPSAARGPDPGGTPSRRRPAGRLPVGRSARRRRGRLGRRVSIAARRPRSRPPVATARRRPRAPGRRRRPRPGTASRGPARSRRRRGTPAATRSGAG